MSNTILIIKRIYLYAVSLIALAIIVISAIILVDMALKTYVFKNANFNLPYPGACPVSAKGPDVVDPNCNTETEAQINYQKESDQASNEREVAQAIAMLLVSIPVFWYHWNLTRKEIN